MLQPAAPLQTTYTRYQLPAVNGMLASSVNFSADTRIVEVLSGSDDSVPFGRAVSQGSFDQNCILGGTKFVGISRLDPTLAISAALTTDQYPEGDNAGILVTGDLWVIAYSAVTVGDSVHYNATDGKLSNAGGQTIDSARWETSAASGTLAVVRLGNIAGKA
jgi:hypothetical protein